MGVLDVLVNWGNRIMILVSVLFLVLTLMSKQANIPLSRATLRVTHLISFSAWFGCSIWVSFIAGVVMMRAVDIETFGTVQTKLFDAYFRFSLMCLATVGFSGAGLAAQDPVPDAPDVGTEAGTMGTSIFLIALSCIAGNLFFFGPQTTITMFERRRVCKDLGVDRKSGHPEVRKLSKRFGMFHGISNLLNLVALVCGFIHVCTLASHLTL